MVAPLLSAPLPPPGPWRGERTGLGSGLRLRDCVQREEMVQLLIKMLRVWTRHGRGGRHHPGCGSGLSKRRWAHRAPLGQPCSQGIWQGPRASWCVQGGRSGHEFSPRALVWGCLHFSFTSVWECACGHPSHLPALCWGRPLRDSRKSPTCVNAVLRQTQREAGTVRVQFPLPWCRLRGPTVCFKHDLVELQLACPNSL